MSATKWRKRPVVVEAVRYGLQEYADHPMTFDHVPDWLAAACEDTTITAEFRGEDYWYLVIKTLEGPMTVSPGDWIIQGVAGEIYPCKDAIFRATYEPVGSSGSSSGATP